jgi:hypothetical protein
MHPISLPAGHSAKRLGCVPLHRIRYPRLLRTA